MTARVKVCPVCWQRVIKAPSKRIAHHFDSIGRDVCPGSRQPWSISIPWDHLQFGRRVAKIARRCA